MLLRAVDRVLQYNATIPKGSFQSCIDSLKELHKKNPVMSNPRFASFICMHHRFNLKFRWNMTIIGSIMAEKVIESELAPPEKADS